MAIPSSFRSRSVEDTWALGERLGGCLEPGDVIALRGELGAGKTSLVQGIARGLGVPAEVPVTSPTFVIASEYPGRLPLRHADFYRVEGYERLLDAGFDDMLDGRGVLIVEWPERVLEALPEDPIRIQIYIEAGESGTVDSRPRLLEFSGGGLRAEQIRQKLVPA